MEVPTRYSENIKKLEVELDEVFINLKLPQVDEKGLSREFLWEALGRTKEAGKYDQYLHMLWVSLAFKDAMMVLGINNPEILKSGVAGAACHDVERIEYPYIVDAKKMKPQDWEILKRHPERARALLLPKDILAADLAGLHHEWQKPKPGTFYGPYPNPINFEPSQEAQLLSKALAIVDFYHRASTTTNGRTPRPWYEKYVLDRLLRQGRPNQDRVEQAVKKEYGDLDLTYKGDKMPKIRTNGQEFLKKMYCLGVFGADDLMERYTKPER